MLTEYEIEHHFERKNIGLAKEQLIAGVKIVKLKERGEFFIEPDIDIKKNLNVVAGGLVLSINAKNFFKEIKGYKETMKKVGKRW